MLAVPMRFLVTGGGGFIGSALVRRLLEEGYRPRVVDNFSTGSKQNLIDVADQIEVIEGDLADPETARRAVDGIDFVLHQAAVPSVAYSVAHPEISHQANVQATLNLLMASRAAKIQRFVFASSSSVYGDSVELPKREGQLPNPVSPYALTKFAAEKYTVLFHRLYGLPTVSLRYFNVFGPRQNPDSPYSAVISRFISSLIRKESPVVYGDGKQSRDFTYVANVVEANLAVCRAESAVGEVFNIGMGERRTLLELLDALRKIMGRHCAPRFSEARAGDVRHSQASVEKARAQLGFQPMVSFEDGLKQTVAWYERSLRSTAND